MTTPSDIRMYLWYPTQAEARAALALDSFIILVAASLPEALSEPNIGHLTDKIQEYIRAVPPNTTRQPPCGFAVSNTTIVTRKA